MASARFTPAQAVELDALANEASPSPARIVALLSGALTRAAATAP